jgi:Tfp pilus assembly protein PilO
MDKLKQWIALTVVGVLAVAAAGWFLLISPKRSEASDIRGLAAQQAVSNSALQTKIAILKSQAKDLPRQQAKLAAVAAKIPDNPALPSLIRALSDVASKTGVELITLSPSAPTAVVAPVAAAVVPTVASPVPGARATAAGAGPAAIAAAGSSAGTLQSIAVTLNVVGGYFQMEQFLDGVEGLSRAMKVTTLNLVPGNNPLKPSVSQAVSTGTLSASITGTVFMSTGALTVPTSVGK